jgi:phosphoglucosamine mutase
MGKYFGTDGIRGKYGDNLDAALSYKTGMALAAYFGGGKFVIGRDTRVSGPEIEAALVKGIRESGGDALLAGIIPTPAVAYLAKKNGAAAGIMVSASHNPPEYNGIKVFDGSGVKLSEEQEGSVEYYIDNPSPASLKTGAREVIENAAADYPDYIVAVSDAD